MFFRSADVFYLHTDYRNLVFTSALERSNVNCAATPSASSTTLQAFQMQLSRLWLPNCLTIVIRLQGVPFFIPRDFPRLRPPQIISRPLHLVDLIDFFFEHAILLMQPCLFLKQRIIFSLPFLLSRSIRLANTLWLPHTFPLHLMRSHTQMHGRDFVHALALIAAMVNTLMSIVVFWRARFGFGNGT